MIEEEEALGPAFGARLREARFARAFTQVEAAERVGMAGEAYARLERGGVVPRADTLVSIARALEVSVDHLLGLSSAPPVPTDKATLPLESRRLVDRLTGLSLRSQRLLELLLSSLERDGAN